MEDSAHIVWREADAPAPAPAGLDPLVVAQLRQLDPDGSRGMLARLFEVYLQVHDRELLRWPAALATGDVPTLIAVVHKLKGSASSIGGRAFPALCQDIERALRLRPEGLSEPVVQRQLDRFMALQAEFRAVVVAASRLPEGLR